MRSGERADESDEARRGKEAPLDREGETEALSWVVRWSLNSNLRQSLQQSSLEHLFRC